MLCRAVPCCVPYCAVLCRAVPLLCRAVPCGECVLIVRLRCENVCDLVAVGCGVSGWAGMLSHTVKAVAMRARRTPRTAPQQPKATFMVLLPVGHASAAAHTSVVTERAATSWRRLQAAAPQGEACTYRPSSNFQINWLIFTLSGDRRFQHAGNRRSQLRTKRHVPESRSHGIQHAWRGPAGRARFRVWGHAPCVISLDRQRAALFATGTHPLDLPSRFACGSAAAVHARERACIRCKGAENARRRGRLEPPRLSSASQTEEDLGLLRHHRRRSAVSLI